MLDASVVVELLMLSPLGQRAATIARQAAGDLHIPHLADVETLSALRALVAREALAPGRAQLALTDLRDFPARRWPASPLFERVWELRDAVTAYDATYVALAEALDARLVTADVRLAHGVQDVASCEVVLVR